MSMDGNKAALEIEPAHHWINGEWVGSSTVAKSINPSTGEVLGQYSAGGRANPCQHPHKGDRG